MPILLQGVGLGDVAPQAVAFTETAERAMMPPDQHTGTISLAEAAAELGLNQRTIRRAIAEGEITATKHGRSLAISRPSLERYAARKRQRQRTARITPSAPPVPLTSFIGREQLVTELSRRVQQGSAHFVTLTGPGGVGKTRLAIRVLERTAARFPDGVAFVPLASVTDPALVLLAIARTLGLPHSGERPPAEQVQRALANSSFLLVLDNLEQVRDAGPTLASLAAACPDLVLLVTSRVPLQVAGEHCVPVPPLTLAPDVSPPHARGGDGALRSLTQAEAVRLFVDRARAVVPDFAQTPDAASDVAAICRRLDGVPLALELAAARLRHLNLTDLRARLDSALSLLVGGPQDAPPRLQTMRAAIAWSHHLLTPAQQTLFRCLAVFEGGFEGDAVAAIVRRLFPPDSAGRRTGQMGDDADTVLEGLSALIDHSLLQMAHSASHQYQPTTRYVLLQTIREYGLELLVTAGEEERVRSAHAAWCLDLARHAEDAQAGPARATWFARLEREQPNFRVALAWFLDRQDCAGGFALVRALAWFWTSKGYLHEATRWADAFLALPNGLTDPSRGEVLREAGNIAHWLGDTATATMHYKAALAHFQEVGDQLGIKYTLRQLSSVSIEQGALDAAASYLAASQAIVPSSAGAFEAWNPAFERYLHGRLAMARGQTAAAIQDFVTAAAAFAAMGDREYVAAARCQQATAYIALGDLYQARLAYRESLALAIELAQPYWMAWSLTGAAYLALQASQQSRAVRLYTAALDLQEETGLAMPDDAACKALSTRLVPSAVASTSRSPQDTRARALNEAMCVLADDVSGARHLEGPLLHLTPREREVLAQLAQGLTDKEIASALQISRHTAINHVAAIRRKLGVQNRAAAVAVAARLEARESA